ncbi:MAG: phosphatase PAP2 family protein [Ruminococcaceae bacterium]|nr:phosphatase PAP2 family protein [Oscillospiraceae bacterium]
MEKFIDFVYKIDGTITEFVQGLYPGDGFFGKAVDLLFYLFTCFSEEIILISLIVFVYWCFNKKMGEGMLLSLYLSNALNGIIKDIVRRPRPFMNPEFTPHLDTVRGDGLVDKAHLAESYSFPSGHSQNAGSFWPALYISYKKEYSRKQKLLKVLPFVIIPLVMISRVYLGVHYGTDTVVGATLGIICAFLMINLYYRFYHKKNILIICIYAISLVALFFNPTADTLKTMGMGLGGIVGFMLENKYVKFSTEGTWKKKALRLIIGVSTLLLIRALFKLILPSMNEGAIFYTENVTLYNWGGFIRYMIMGLYGTFIYPAIFKKLGI